MSEPDDGGPAFPETRWNEKIGQEVQWIGMTLRDYFAAKAMQSLILHPNTAPKEWEVAAYSVADAMLKARNK